MKNKAALSLFSLVLIAGCGGSSDSDPAPAPPVATPAPGEAAPPASSPPAAPPAAPTPAGPPTAGNANVPVLPDGFISGDRTPVATSPAYPDNWPAGTELHLFSGESNPAYLGCLTCAFAQAESICNESGSYGSTTGSTSIFNDQTSAYGTPSSPTSIWNPSSPSGPVVVGWDKARGNVPEAFSIFGQWTANETGPWRFGRSTIGQLDFVADTYTSTQSVASARTAACVF